MTTITKFGVGAVVIGALLGFCAFLGFHLGGGSGAQLVKFGATFISGQVQNTPMIFTNGFSAGSSQQFYVDGSGNLTNSGTTALGASGSAITSLVNGTCNLNFGVAPGAIAASSTITVDCQRTNMLASATAVQATLTGVAAGDRVFMTMPTTTPTTGITVLSANASGTPGYITMKLYNNTGASLTPGTTTTSGIQYLDIR